jgi:pilus assembly protein CpaB
MGMVEMRRGSLFILLVALVMGGIAAFLARNWLQIHSAQAVFDRPEKIVVAVVPLGFGAAITPEEVREVPWPANSAPEGAFSSVRDMIKDGRRIVLSPFVRNEPIVASKISAPNGRASLSTVIAEGKRAVTVAVDDVRGVAGFIFPGDFVDIALTRTNNNNGPQNFSEVILQHVKVLAIDQLAGERQDHPTVVKAVTVEVTEEEALKILLATNIGRLSLILRQSTESAMAPDMRITDHDLYGGESADALAGPTPSLGPAAGPLQPSPIVVAAGEPSPEGDPTTRKVTVVRSMKSEDYEVPRDTR